MRSPRTVLIGSEAARASDSLAVLVEDPRKGHHDECEESEHAGCPLIAQVVVHLHAKERKDSYEQPD